MNKYEKFKNMNLNKKNVIIRDIERSCFNSTIDNVKKIEYSQASWDIPQFRNLYHNICYNVSVNLDYESDVGSKFLGDSILNKTISINNIGKLSSKEMCPQKYIDIYEKLNKIHSVVSKVKTTELYKCRKCKKNQCVIKNVINRSLDEGTSLSITCQFCGHEWGG